MPLDPQIQEQLELFKNLNVPPLHQRPLKALRTPYSRLPQRAEPQAVALVEERYIPGPDGEVPARIYTPSENGPHPLLIYLHGGGWTFGNLESGDASCRALAAGAGCVVVSVDYRLAPEHPFPAGLEDGYAATVWAAQHATELKADASRLAVCGESAGGNLAAAVAMLARNRGGPAVALQVLIYPNTDAYGDLPSMLEAGDTLIITRADVLALLNNYAPTDADKANPLVSLMRAPDLSRLPAALVITAEYDPLRDEGERYAERLREAGVPVTLSRYDGMIHGFFSMAHVLDSGQQAIEQVSVALRTAFSH